MQTRFVVVALPHSAREDDEFHVSLFVSPKLEPDGDEGKLNEHKAFVNWTRKLARATFTLRDQNGTIDCEALLDRTDPTVWPKAFRPSTPVRGQAVPDWSNRTFHSFDARNVTTLAKTIHAAGMLASPTRPPTVAEHPLTGPMKELTSHCYRPDRRYTVGREPQFRHLVYDESIATEELDAYLAEGGGRRLLGVTDFDAAESVTSLGSLAARMAVELHRARRFYERPESLAQQDYQARPDTPAEPLPQRGQEFHERCVACGDHPALLRKLGLVVDLRVHDVDRLATSAWLEGAIEVPDAECLTTRTRCRRTADDSLVTVGTSEDWRDGALLLGREDRFAVLDVDADGSALKSERFIWSIPRLDKVEQNGDEINGASPALRSYGFTVARTGQGAGAKDSLARQRTLESSIGNAPELATEDVTRGMRIEVWDDHMKRWRSLHQRLTDVQVEGFGTVLDDLEDEGFVQGTPASTTPGAPDTAPVYVHEAMFGWDGWSLSAARPGKRIRKATPEELAADPDKPEIVEDVPGAPQGRWPYPLMFGHRAKPGSLPRLRYGRSYAFRAWQVDLAGNSRPHDLDPKPAAPVAEVAAVIQDLVKGLPADGARLWSTAVRHATQNALTEGRFAAPAAEPEELSPELTAALATRLAEVRGARRQLPDLQVRSLRRTAVHEAARAAVDAMDEPLVLETAVRDALRVSDLAATQAASLKLAGPVTDLAVQALASVTRLKPFLRWDPVQPPAVVPRKPFTEGESLRVLVIRSGVTQDKDTLAVDVTSPADYTAEVTGRHPDYQATSERHLAPPKTTQMTAELHGMFDTGIGAAASEKADADAMLAWALTEDGSFLDQTRADLDDPTHRIDQPRMTLVDPPVPQTDLKALPLAPGEPPAPGQYAIHDTEELTIPYLPDPLARGVSFVFPEAGRDRPVPLPFPFGGEGFTAAYRGTWPRVEPFRLVLSGAQELDGRVAGRTVDIRLPAGDIQRFQLSSTIPKDKLGVLGPWATVSSLFTGAPEVVEAAADGWLWGLSPSEPVMLVHAVPRPLAAPRPINLVARRISGQTAAWLQGGLELHGASTDSVTAEASWVDPVDDLAAPGPDVHSKSEAAFQTRVHDWEDIAVLSLADVVASLPDFGPLALHQAFHRFEDTKHRNVTYRFRATTRFREYFAPDLLAPDPANPLDDGKSVVSETVTLDVPSSARPAAPVVHSVIPLFRWEHGAEPEQPMARRHVRRAGVRIYLERPWYSSGDGELLAVLLAPPSGDVFGPEPEDQSGFPWVSKVGSDPVWFAGEWDKRPLQPMTLDNVLALVGWEDRRDPGRPVTVDPAVTLPTQNGSFQVQAVGYQPQYSTERQLWYVDVALDPGHTMWTFLRLAVARYQPSSVDGCHLSMPVRCNFVQLPPERSVSVSRTDESHVRVVLSGATGTRRQAGRDQAGYAQRIAENRVVVARLQRRNPAVDSDLGWDTVTTQQLAIRGSDDKINAAVWTGELDAGERLPMRRPRDGSKPASPPSQSGWRVTIEEWERFPGDPLSPVETGPVMVGPPAPVWEQRLVFADEVML